MQLNGNLRASVPNVGATGWSPVFDWISGERFVISKVNPPVHGRMHSQGDQPGRPYSL
jgi:hypothetical protein